MKAIWSHKKIMGATLILLGVGIFCLFSYAGTLEPTDYPGSTMHTLDEIYGAAGSRVGPVYAAEDRWVAAMQISGVTGPWDFTGYTGWIKLADVEYNFTHSYDSWPPHPLDQGTWQPGIMTVVKEMDSTSPLLIEKCYTGITIPTVTIDWFRKNPSTGNKEAYMRIVLTNAGILNFGQKMTHRGDDQFAHCEELSFAWETMTLTWLGPPEVTKTVPWE